jgi:hypothetical protein
VVRGLCVLPGGPRRLTRGRAQAFWQVCDHPRVMPIIDHYLGADCILGSLASRIVRP